MVPGEISIRDNIIFTCTPPSNSLTPKNDQHLISHHNIRPVTKEQRTDAIYSIPCNDCDNEYIGQTNRQFGARLKEHQKAVFLCKKENSALSEHTCLTNHTIGWDNSKIITTNRRYHQHLCLEAWHINSAQAPLNRDDGGLLPDTYLHLIRKKGC